ncbi:hypothetical protein ACE3MZ_00945 [Paenibacillus sp. WLX1005]|uniref:hypothetical protein n=1 Tax=Paenibacillus sp. WLX1005 TaxID=3243766 RepID=UPI003983DD25
MQQAIQIYVKKQLIWDVLMIILFVIIMPVWMKAPLREAMVLAAVILPFIAAIGIWSQHHFMKRQRQTSSEE